MRDQPAWITVRDGGVTVAIKAVPRSRHTQAVGLQDDRVRVQIAAPPHDGQSNAALMRYLADLAGVRPSALRIHRGSSGARKLVEIDGDATAIADKLVTAFAGLGDPA